MWDALVTLATEAMKHGDVGLIVLLVIGWFIDHQLLVRDLRRANEKLVEVVAANTAAQTTLSELIRQLCSRI